MLEQKGIEEKLLNVTLQNGSSPEKLERFLELAGDAWLSHQWANPDDARRILKIFTSNRQAEGQKIYLEPAPAFAEMASRPQIESCAPERAIPRTWDKIIDSLAALNSRGELPDLSSLAGFQHRHDVAAPMKDEQDDGIPLAA